jgi:hypothetical protein
MHDPLSLDAEQKDCLSNHSADLSIETYDRIRALYTGWEKIADAAEILYAARANLTMPWIEHLVHLLQFISINGFDLVDGGRLRAPALLAEVLTQSENPPAPSPRFTSLIVEPL